MPANEFEKQVQKQLDDFQLNPSATVWKNVEAEIRKKKRRRVIFFILMPLALGLIGYLSYHLLYTGQKTELTDQSNAVNNEKPLATDKKNNSAKINPQTDQTHEIPEQGLLEKEKIIQKQKKVDARGDGLQITSNNPSTVSIKNKQTIKPADKTTTVQKTNNNLQVDQNVPVTIGKPVTTTGKEDEAAKTTDNKTNHQKDETDVAAKDPVVSKTDSAKAGSVNDPENNKKETIAKKKVDKGKIKWGISFSAGISGNSVAAFSFGGEKSLDLLSYNPGSTAGTGQTAVVGPSSVHAGFSFRTGIVAELQISKRSTLSTGLQYAYASNHINIGRKEDTLIRLNNFSAQADAFYRGVQRNNYTNSFHFIQVPLEYHLQLNKGNKLPLQWDAGLSFGYLIATNGLVYDTSYSGIYYRNKEAFNRFHFNMETGLSARLKTRNGSEWIIGPEVSFDTRKLIDNRWDKKQYLLYGGIRTRFLFLQNKR